MKIAIVCDNPLVIERLIRTITTQRDHEIVWVAWSGCDAIEQCQRELPDSVLIQIDLADDCVPLVGHIMKYTPCPILLMTSFNDQYSEIVFKAMSAGALDALVIPGQHEADTSHFQESLLKKIDMMEILTQDSKAHNQDQAHIVRKEKLDGSAKHLVAIGSSSGGPEALAQLFNEIPANCGAAFVVIQHVDAYFAASLAEWLDRQTRLSVEIARPGGTPIAGKVLIAGTDNHLILNNNGILEYTKQPLEAIYRPSIDVFFYSVLYHWKHPATAILLTGMGRDGAEGLRALKRSGIHTIAQDSATAAVYGMPKTAKDIGATCETRSIKEIANYLLYSIL